MRSRQLSRRRLGATSAARLFANNVNEERDDERQKRHCRRTLRNRARHVLAPIRGALRPIGRLPRSSRAKIARARGSRRRRWADRRSAQSRGRRRIVPARGRRAHFSLRLDLRAFLDGLARRRKIEETGRRAQLATDLENRLRDLQRPRRSNKDDRRMARELSSVQHSGNRERVSSLGS